MIDPIKYKYSFLSGSNNIFRNKNDKDNRNPKIKKGRSHSSRVHGILKSDDSRDLNHNKIISNIDSTHRKERVTNYKGDSKSKSRPLYKNKDLKYKNNKTKSRKTVKSTVHDKTNNSNEDNKDKDNNNSIPGLQDRDLSDSYSNVGTYNRSDNKNYQDTESDDKYYQLPFDHTSMKSTITS